MARASHSWWARRRSFLPGLMGCFLGAIAGYFGHGTDEVVSKITEIFLAFPFLLLAIALMAFLGQGVINIILALMMSRWVQYCRVVRGEVFVFEGARFCHRGQGARRPGLLCSA